MCHFDLSHVGELFYANVGILHMKLATEDVTNYYSAIFLYDGFTVSHMYLVNYKAVLLRMTSETGLAVFSFCC